MRGSRVFTKVTFWNSVEYKILCGSDLTSAEFRRIFHCLIPRNSVGFRAILCTEFRIRNLNNKFMQKTLDFSELKPKRI
jgi:hypothetical protein